MNAMKILWIAVLFLVGWLWSYLFIRQIWFDFSVALPTLRKMKEADENLIAYDNAKKYTGVSIGTCIFIALIVAALVAFLKFLDIYLKIGFIVGALVCIVMLAGNVVPENKKLFEAFCGSYYRFVPDDQLRTDMFNRKFPAMKLRCHDMDVSTSWIPSFRKEEK